MIYFAFVLGLIVFAGMAFWRYGCRLTSIPWPSWLAWVLEPHNPYMNVFCHPKQIVRQLDLKPEMRVLDIGCGAGRIAIPVAQELGPFGILHAVDMQAGMVQRCRKRLSAHGITNTLVCKDKSEHLNLSPEFYDLVYLVTVLGELTEPQKLIEKIALSLKFNGRLAVTEVLPDPCYVSRSKLKQLAEEASLMFDREYRSLVSYTAIYKKA